MDQCEILVVDGGSVDRSREIVRADPPRPNCSVRLQEAGGELSLRAVAHLPTQT